MAIVKKVSILTLTNAPPQSRLGRKAESMAEEEEPLLLLNEQRAQMGLLRHYYTDIWSYASLFEHSLIPSF